MFHALTLEYGAVIPETADFTRIFHGAATGAVTGTGVIPMNDEKTPKEKEVKRRFQSWLRPSTIKLMDRLYEDDNCKSKSEFIEKAVRFYIGYLHNQDHTAIEYLAPQLAHIIEGYTKGSEQRLARAIFKLAVEVGAQTHMLAAINDIEETTLFKLRDMVTDEVRRINGIINFESAVRYQRSEE